MTGSLLQIVSTDLKDAFLTIDPQITFFKIVYLRHTPFAIDLIEEPFNLIPNFGEEGFCQLSKLGDLISNIFLKVEIPSVQISNLDDGDLLTDYETTTIQNPNGEFTAANHVNDFNLKINSFKAFSSSAMTYWRQIYDLVTNGTSNYSTVQKLITSILTSQNNVFQQYQLYNNAFYDVNFYVESLQINFNFDLLGYIQSNFTSYSDSIYNTKINIEYKKAVKDYLISYLDYQKYFLNYLISNRDLFIKISGINASSNYYFAWVKKLAFALIANLSIEINGQEVDRVNGDIMSIWYELSTPLEKIDILNKMIGNVEIMTSYDNNLKPNYTLIIPIPFWFCKYKSQALPCVGLKYSDVIVKVRFNELTECCYFEPYELNTYSSNINLNNSINISNVSLLVEYIHLGDTERNKFGTFTIETLIEQHRIIEFSEITSQNALLPLDFVNPVREIIWTVQKTSHIKDFKLKFNYETNDYYYANIQGTKQSGVNVDCIVIILDDDKSIINFINYQGGTIEIINSKYYNGIYKILEANSQTITVDSKKMLYPDKFIIKINKPFNSETYVDLQTLQIYGNDIISKRDANYFSLVKSFQTHTSINPNIYTYSFALFAEMFQPSGTLNFSVIDSKNLYSEFNKITYDKLIANNDSFTVKIISRSHNMLKIENGQAKTLFGL